MKILKMRASFGKLRGELNLEAGFNLLHLPNEGGKSTWSAFLVAMLYGIDTSERASAANQGLPLKERYRPWDGRAMEGSMELLWQGRRITLERSSTAKSPMGGFKAYDTESGLPIEGLTGANCGKLLCGVERSVFERTAFIRQLGLAVTEDAALEKRLGALVSTGEEGGKTYLELEKALKDRKNKLSGRVGRIPKLSTQAELCRKNLQELRALGEEAMELRGKIELAARQQQTSAALLDRISKAKAAQKRAGLEELEQKIQSQTVLCRRLEEAVPALPSEPELHGLQRELDSRENALQTAKMDAAFASVQVEKPVPPQGFGGLGEKEALEKAKAEVSRYETLTQAEKKGSPLPLICSLLLLAAGAGLCFWQLYAGLAVAAAGLIALIFVLILDSKRKAQAIERQNEARLIPLRYGVSGCAELMSLAESYAADWKDYESRCQAVQAQKESLLQDAQAAQTALDAVISQVQRFAPQCQSSGQCRDAICLALRTHEEMLSEKRQLENLLQQRDALALVLGGSNGWEADPEALALDEAKIAYEERNAAQKLAELNSRYDRINGAISAKGDPVSMEAELEKLQEELALAQEQTEAIDIALAALRSADETLRSRFSPQITAEAGKILGELTGNKYPAVLLEPDLRLSVREEGGTVMRPAAAMSCGTADQMYLALRLAMCHQLLPAEAPLILDDALVNFDEKRAAAALSLLQKEAESRQVILFTCREV